VDHKVEAGEVGRAPAAGKRLGARAKAGMAALVVLGLAAATVAIVASGARDVLGALGAVGVGGFALLCFLYLVLHAGLGLSWAVLCAASWRQSLGFVWARLLRDAVTQILPFTPLAGPVAGARALANRGVGRSQATAAAVTDLSLEYFAGIGFLGIGGLLALLKLAHVQSDTGAFHLLVVAALAVAGVVGAGLWFAPGLVVKTVERFADRLPEGAAAEAGAVHAAIEAVWSRKARVLAGFVTHLASWILGAAWGWVALWLLGAPAPLSTVVALEALICAARAAGFMVPNAVGVQEGAYALLGPLFGVPADTAVALSLLKRGRDLVTGAPLLMLWQVEEARRLRRRRA
jgi:putative membrane protein